MYKKLLIRYLQGGLPFLPITLTHTTRSAEVSALVDSGSTVNVLPYGIGIQLGLIWENQNFPMPHLVGILQDTPAFGVLLTGEIDPFEPVALAFAWVKSNNVPVILGQVNFFSEFDVYFFGSRKIFDIMPKQ
ncbi:hypothetical protein [Desulfonema magnum]|uniref:Peptidase A2 domain-containing protein n=1 Tax=Desulfonema magnum TaxID=45655 RepID=A0A975BZS3_9BACT|nr:hypothetical protein [Desulfonema magnum]QTA93952.1 Uncharacterized protein dnm_100620 [Desulfonema magnum]